MVVLLELLPRMRAWRNSTETQQLSYVPRSGLEVKNGSSAKDGAPERLRYCTNVSPPNVVVRSPPSYKG